MTFADIKEKTENELGKALAEKRAELQKLRSKLHLAQEKDVRKVREVRKEIAHLLTALTKRQKPPVSDETSPQ